MAPEMILLLAKTPIFDKLGELLCLVVEHKC